jgi:hypothetical protein
MLLYTNFKAFTGKRALSAFSLRLKKRLIWLYKQTSLI